MTQSEVEALPVGAVLHTPSNQIYTVVAAARPSIALSHMMVIKLRRLGVNARAHWWQCRVLVVDGWKLHEPQD